MPLLCYGWSQCARLLSAGLCLQPVAYSVGDLPCGFLTLAEQGEEADASEAYKGHVGM